MAEKKQPTIITHQFMKVVKLPDGDTRLDRFLIPALMAGGILFSGIQFLRGDLLLAAVSAISVFILLGFAIYEPEDEEKSILGREFDRFHAFYITLFWAYSIMWVSLLRTIADMPSTGKDSGLFYVAFLLFVALTYRTLVTAYGLTKTGSELLITRIPIREQLLVVLNELLATGLVAFTLGSELAKILQPNVFTLQTTPIYIAPLLVVTILYYLLLQMMWIRRWNKWLSKPSVWLSIIRLLGPLALISATTVILYHFTKLSEPRSANLLDSANFNQTVLALSPIIWMMVLYVVLFVYSSHKGLKDRFLPDGLLQRLPDPVQKVFETLSDMDILLIFGVLFFSVPVYLFIFDTQSNTFVDTLRTQIVQQNSLIDSSEQALAFIFALPFYVIAVGMLALYAYVFVDPELSAKTRDDFVKQLPIGMLIMFIITLYLCAIPFNIILTEGRLPQLPQELGRVLAFDILIPLTLLYGHYFIFIRIPYGRGQTQWRKGEAARLDRELKRTEQRIEVLANRITRSESLWKSRSHAQVSADDRIAMLYEVVELNGQRDQLNMERLLIIDQKQQLSEVSEAPVSLTIAQLPTRMISLGIPLLLAFKVYEWAVVNDGLREIANNPNIGVLEFFQIILEQLQF